MRWNINCGYFVCRAMTTTTTTIAPTSTGSPNQIYFSDPIPQTIESTGKKYYMQNATNNGQDIMVCSDWFRIDGIKAGLDKKPEMLVKMSGRVRETFNVIEKEAVQQLRVPPDMLESLKISAEQMNNDKFYKPLYSGEFMYIKLHRDCSFFNSRRELVRRSELGYGEYRVLLCVKGLYIGSNAENGAMASLHIRIFQIQFREVNGACLFEASACLHAQNTPPPTQTINQPSPVNQPLQTQQPSTSNKKNSRGKSKPALARQNAVEVVEAEQQVPTEISPHDFFVI